MKKYLNKYKKYIVGIIIFLALIATSIDTWYATESEPKLVTYDKFLSDLNSGKIDKVYYSVSEEYMRYTYHNSKTRKLSPKKLSEYKHKKKDEWRMTEYPAYEEFRKELLEKNVQVVVKSFEPKSIVIITGVIPLCLGVYLIYLLFKLLKTSISFGSIKDEDLLQTSNKKFKDVIGHDEVLNDIKFIVKLMQNKNLGGNLGVTIPKGILFSGEPGTGKTLLAKAIAGEAGVPFIYANASSFVEMYVGLGAKRVREIFKLARKNKPCIIFLDEIDAIGTSRNNNSSNTEQSQTINALLQEMDGFSTEAGIIVIGATNMPEKLDKALLRAGRFDREIVISPPKDWKVRKELFEHYLKDKPVGSDVDISVISKQLTGFTGADIEALVNEASLVCALRDGGSLSLKDFEEAIDKVVFKGNRSNEEEYLHDKKIVAYHEAGHAVVSYLLGIPVARASIIGTTSGVGGAVFHEDSESQFLTDADIRNKIMVCYGGRASEELTFSSITTGACNDITQATKLIQGYVQKYGFDSHLNLLDMGVLERYMDTDSMVERYSEISKQLYNETKELLKNNYKLVECLAENLIENETISGSDLRNLLGGKNA